jgi:hypothetical protein
MLPAIIVGVASIVASPSAVIVTAIAVPTFSRIKDATGEGE